MGVMSCSKRNCENIMCDTYVNGVGYVCDDCQKQFKLWLQTQSPLYLDSNSFMKQKLNEFMNEKKEIDLGSIIQINEAVNKLFDRNRDY